MKKSMRSGNLEAVDREKTSEKPSLDNKVFFSTIISLIIPITLQNLISSSLNMVDNLMIGELGEHAIAATGLVNQYFFIFMLTISGINAGASIFIAQFWGRKDRENIGRMIGLDLALSLVAALIFMLPAIFKPDFIMRIFVDEAGVVGLGSDYLEIIAVTFALTALTQAFSTVIRSIGIARPPMYGSLLGVLVNASLNWVLIFGKLGLPALGVRGAAIATSIARLVEMVFILISAYTCTDIIPRRLKNLINFDLAFVKKYFKTSISVILNEIFWGLGLTTYSIIYAKIGIAEVASMQIATTLQNIFMVLVIGLATSASIIVGNKIGSGEEALAKEYAKRLGILAPLVGLVSAVLLWMAAPGIVSIFNIDYRTKLMAINVLRTMAVFSALRFFNVTMIVGVFRGGGDTLYSMLVQLGTVWLFAIPGGYLGATIFKLGLEKVYLIIACEELIKIPFIRSRLKSGNWIKNVVDSL